MMMAEHRHLADNGAELVELRLDYIRRPVNLGRLLKDRGCPVVITCRRPQDGGKWMRSESDRITLLRSAIVAGAEYVDLEMEIAGQIPRYKDTQRIISYHNFDVTPGHLEDIHHEMTKLDPDIIKIVTMANNPVDNMAALRLCRDSDIPTVAFCMGEMGQVSRILCGKFGSPMTYATFSSDRKLAPGMLTHEELRDHFHYDSITADTGVLGVIADPVAHSISPAIHNACIRQQKLDLLYLPFRVPSEALEEFIGICPEMDVRGLSVTIPHKEKILKLVSAVDDNVAGIKAANTVVFKNANSSAFNTDCSAAIESLEHTLASIDVKKVRTLEGQRVLLLGAGGVARAIAFGLKRAGAKVIIAARDFKKAEALADALEMKPIDWPARLNCECNVLINCTPVGMHPNMDESPFEKDSYQKNTIVFDTIYNPEQTLFIKQARELGCVTVTGVDMFVRQAARQFKLFTDKEPDLELIRGEVKRALSAAKY